MLRPEFMLVRVQEPVCMPNALNSGRNHASPHFSYDLEEEYGPDFGEVVYSRFFGQQGHQAILPPLGNVMMLPHEGGKLKDHLSSSSASFEW